MKLLIIISLLSYSILGLAIAGSEPIAKALIVKGEASVKRIGTSATDKVILNDNFFEGDSIKTSPKSFVKVIFNDKSQMNLGPESEMVISSFPKGEAGVITLVQGQLRSKVSKDYTDIKNKEQSKLFVKTKTAAMGVRGTDFLVIFNEKNQNTALITFEGRVAMAKIDETERFARLNQQKLETIVSSNTAVMVTRGQYSGATPEANRVTIPIKISPKQFEVLKEDENLDQTNSGKNQDNTSKAVRSPIPPGVNTKNFVVDESKKVAEITGVNSREIASTSETVAPEGGFTKDGGFAPTAGGPIDLKTGIYIAPDPTKGTFDSNTGTYQIDPLTQGKVSGGTYQPPIINGIAYKLTDDGKLVVDQSKTDALKDDGRSPASAPLPTAPPPTVVNSMVPGIPIEPVRLPAMEAPQLDMINNIELDYCSKYPTQAICGGSSIPVKPVPESISKVKFIIQIK